MIKMRGKIQDLPAAPRTPHLDAFCVGYLDEEVPPWLKERVELLKRVDRMARVLERVDQRNQVEGELTTHGDSLPQIDVIVLPRCVPPGPRGRDSLCYQSQGAKGIDQVALTRTHVEDPNRLLSERT